MSPPENNIHATVNSVPVLFQYLKLPIQVLKKYWRRKDVILTTSTGGVIRGITQLKLKWFFGWSCAGI